MDQFSDPISDPISDGDQRTKKPMPEGVRFKPGISPCPGGWRGLVKRATADEIERLTKHLGREPSINETSQAEALAVARITKPTSATDALKRANTISRVSGRLYGRSKPAAASSPMPAFPSVDSIIRDMARAK